jgi:hypothetical protein
MAIIKPEQLSRGTYSISGSFSGSFHGDGSDLNNLPLNVLSYNSFGNFPDTGSEGYIYIDNSANIGYLWDSGSIPPTYVNIAGPSTPPDVLPLTFANAATVLALSPSPLYNNGISGSGAVLTGSINGVLSDNTNPGKIDYIYTPVVGDVILVKNQSTGSQNGLYTITSTGSVSSKYVLTRTDEYDVSSELFPLQVNILTGTNNNNKSFIQSTANPVIGTSSLVFSAASPSVSFSPQIAFIDTVIDTPLTNIVYATGSFSSVVPGNGATITSTVPGTLGTWNGLSVNTNSKITGSFTKVLVINQTNPAHNGDYSVITTGSAAVFWQLQRINNNASGFDRYTRFFLVSNTSSSKAGRMYFTRPNSPVLTNATIGTAPINIFEYGGTSTSAFPFTGSALITGSLGITGSFDILAPPIVNNTAVYAGFRMADVPGAFFQLTNYSTSSGAFIPTIRSFHPPTGTGTGLQLIAQIGNDGAANANPAMTFNVMSQSAAVGQIRNRTLFTWENNNTSSMALTTVGLAIGSNLLTPSASLHINNTSSFNSFLVEDDTRPDASPFVINNAGKVGIGTTTPTASLDIKASSSAATDITFRVRNSANTIDIISVNGDGIIYKPHASSNDDNPIEIFNSQMSDGRNKISLFTKGSFNLSSGIGISFQSDAAGTTKSSYTLNGASIFAGTSYKDNAGLSEFNVGTSNVTGYSFLRLKDNGGTNTNVYISRTGTIILNPDNANAQVRGLALFSGSLGANADRVIAVGNGTSPTTSNIDSFQFWSNDIVAGNAAPHFRTEAGNIVKLYTQAAVTSSQGIADALTNLGLLTGSSIIVTTPTSGPFGISNLSGSYTYYSTLSASMAAASSLTNAVVEVFANYTETGNVTIIIPNGVTIQGNGYTYTNTNASVQTLFTNANNANCNIYNYNVTYAGTSTTGRCILVSAGTVDLLGTIITITDNAGTSGAYCVQLSGGGATVRNGTAIATGSANGFINQGGTLINPIARTVNGVAVYNVSGNTYNALGITSGTGIGIQGGNFYKATGIASGNARGASLLGNCHDVQGFSQSNVGVYIDSGVYTNITGISNGSFGVQNQANNCIVNNLRAISTVSNGFFTQNVTGVIINGGIIESVAATVVSCESQVSFNNVYIKSTWNSVNGHGIRAINVDTIELINCTIEVLNTSANCIFASNARTVKYVGNKWKTATTPVNANITQGMTNTQDNQGNIII